MFKFIALAEDDQDDQVLFAEALRQVCSKSTLQAVVSGGALLDLLEAHRDALPDVVVLDVNMPGMSGIECLKVIRQTTAFEHLPVIIMSTSSDPKTIRDAYVSGANSYAVKPYRFNDLKRIVDKIISTDWLLCLKHPDTFMLEPHPATS